jgi:hypothetical protein
MSEEQERPSSSKLPSKYTTDFFRTPEWLWEAEAAALAVEKTATEARGASAVQHPGVLYKILGLKTNL